MMPAPLLHSASSEKIEYLPMNTNFLRSASTTFCAWPMGPADREQFADLVANEYLPKERAEGCADEYKQVVRAMNKLIRPYIDPKLAAQVRKKRWLNLDSEDAFQASR